jgi:type IV pilus assembly protein PilN
MAHINLLPWREAQRKERQRQFTVVAIGSAVFMGLVVFYVHLHFNGLIEQQTNRNVFLEKQIAEVEKNIKQIQTLETDKQNLLSRMKIIQQLQGSRPEIVKLFYEIANSLPDGVYLTKLKRSGTNLEIEGVAESNANVSNFMKNLDDSDWLASPALEVIDTRKKEYPGLSWFNLRVSQSRPNTKEEMEAKR